MTRRRNQTVLYPAGPSQPVPTHHSHPNFLSTDPKNASISQEKKAHVVPEQEEGKGVVGPARLSGGAKPWLVPTEHQRAKR